MEKRTMVVIGALILLAAIPIGVLAFTDSGTTGSACRGQVQACEPCAGCGPDCPNACPLSRRASI